MCIGFIAVVLLDGEREEAGELKRPCAADGEGFDHELAAEFKALDIGGGFE